MAPAIACLQAGIVSGPVEAGRGHRNIDRRVGCKSRHGQCGKKTGTCDDKAIHSNSPDGRVRKILSIEGRPICDETETCFWLRPCAARRTAACKQTTADIAGRMQACKMSVLQGKS